MKGGVIFGTLFFVLLTFAAWTSALGLMEPAVAWLTERHEVSRVKATMALGASVFGLGVFTALSPNVLSDVRFGRGTFFDNIDFLASSIMLPLVGFFIVIFAGWVMCRNSSSEELAIGTGLRFNLWRFLARFVAPAAILFIFINTMLEALA
jgi:NSS family neurotransmitter:Na+ symporter